MKKNQFKVINRVTRQEQVFNSEELKRFFTAEWCKETKTIIYKNNWSDYAISTIKKSDTLFNFIIALFGTGLVICLTKIIMLYVIR